MSLAAVYFNEEGGVEERRKMAPRENAGRLKTLAWYMPPISTCMPIEREECFCRGQRITRRGSKCMTCGDADDSRGMEEEVPQ
jgi:hypothetical protein